MTRTTHRDRRAFTAVEVILVTALFAAASLGLLGYTKEAPRREAVAVGEASTLRDFAQRHYQRTGQCPTMEALVRTRMRIAFAQVDPWGKEYWFACRDGEVTVISDGADRRPFTADDVGDPALRAPLRRRGAS